MQRLLRSTDRPIENNVEKIKVRIYQSNSSRIENYLSFNPDLHTHPIYADSAVPEAVRKAFSEIRLAHIF